MAYSDARKDHGEDVEGTHERGERVVVTEVGQEVGLGLGPEAQVP